MTRSLLAAAAAAALLSACATLGDSRADLAGQTLRMTAANGQVTTLRFGSGGRIRATFGSRALDGRWRLVDGNLCFFWPRAERECWPYREPFVRGRTRTITSDRGNVVRVTRL